MIDENQGSGSATPTEPPKQNAPESDRQPSQTTTDDESGGIPIDMAIDRFGKKDQKKKRSFHIWPSHLSKKKQIALAVALVIIIGSIIGFFVYSVLFAKSPTTYVAPAVQQKAAPTTEASRLTGVEIDPALNDRPVTGVMIENSPDARPQSGLHQAGVVYEAVAEAGITRFLALYQESVPDRIGPVRSARPYYLDWVLGFDAAYAHVGGSPEALQQIKQLKVKDLDQFSNSQYFRRIPERYAPHNVYTNMKDLDAAKKARGITKSEFKSFERKKEKKVATPTDVRINLAISSALYNVEYRYDGKTNSYQRLMGGTTHKDEKSGKVITPKVVVALVMKKGLARDGYHTTYQTTGSGAMTVFQDGTKTTGTWTKKDRKSQFVFTDDAGKPIKLNPGLTWITVVDRAGAITSAAK
jgi:hypothetical protein